MNKRFFLLFSFFLLCFIKCLTNSNPLNYSNGFHILKGIWNAGDGPREYKFRNMPADIGFISIFPQSAIESLSDSNKLKVVIEYWIYISVNDAELAMVERLDMS